MATTFNTYTGNGILDTYALTFPYLETTDVSVTLDGVSQVVTTDYTFLTATSIQFTTAPGNGVAIRIFRDTDIDAKQATFATGASIRAGDLNDNFDQILYTAQELEQALIDAFLPDDSVESSMIVDGAVTSAKIADGTIVDADISATAEIAVSKLADGSARQLLQTDAGGTGVEWTSNVDVPGTLDVAGAATFDSTLSVPSGTEAAPSITFTSDTDTGFYRPGDNILGLTTAGIEWARCNGAGAITLLNSAGAGRVSFPTANGTAIRVNDVPNTTTLPYNIGVSLGFTISDSGVNNGYGVISDFTVPNAYTLTGLRGFEARNSPYGAGASVTDVIGFIATNDLNQTGTTNVYGFKGELNSGSGVYNLYMSGTADNYIGGKVGIGTSGVTNFAINDTTTGYGIYLTGIDNASANATLVGMFNDYTISDSGVAAAYGHISDFTVPAGYTLSNLRNFEARGSAYGAGAAVTTSMGFSVSSNLSQGATSTWGFRGAMASASGVYNLYMDGSADNYLKGNLNLGDPNNYFDQPLEIDAVAFSTNQDPSGILLRSTGDFDASNGWSAGLFLGSDSGGTPEFGIYAPNNTNAGSHTQQPAYLCTGSGTAQRLQLYAGQSERMRIDSSGYVGIRTNSPSTALEVARRTDDTWVPPALAGISTIVTTPGNNNAGSGSAVSIMSGNTAKSAVYFGDSDDGDVGHIQYDHSNDSMQFVTDNSERMRIRADGGVEYKDSTGSDIAVVNDSPNAIGFFQSGVENSLSKVFNIGIVSDYSITDSGVTSGYGFLSDFTVPASYSLTNLFHYDAQQTAYGAGASVGTCIGYRAASTLDQGATNTFGFQGQLASASGVYNLYMDGTANNYLNGTVLISRTNTTIDSSNFGTRIGGSSDPGRLNTSRNVNGTFATASFFGSTGSCLIKGDGDLENTNNSYGAISDIKFKENIVDANSQWEDIKGIQFRNYNFKEETGWSTHTQLGVVAQELQQVSPGLVTEGVHNEETGETALTVNYSVLYLKAAKALQEALLRIEDLEQRLNNAGI